MHISINSGDEIEGISTQMGTPTWCTFDPAGYVDGGSLYQYVGSNSLKHVDPTGNAIFVVEANPKGTPPSTKSRWVDTETGKEYKTTVENAINSISAISEATFNLIRDKGAGVFFAGEQLRTINKADFLKLLQREIDESEYFNYNEGNPDKFDAELKKYVASKTIKKYDVLVVSVHGEMIDEKPTGRVVINGSTAGQEGFIQKLAKTARNFPGVALIASCFRQGEKTLEGYSWTSRGMADSVSPPRPLKECKIAFDPVQGAKTKDPWKRD